MYGRHLLHIVRSHYGRRSGFDKLPELPADSDGCSVVRVRKPSHRGNMETAYGTERAHRQYGQCVQFQRRLHHNLVSADSMDAADRVRMEAEAERRQYRPTLPGANVKHDITFKTGLQIMADRDENPQYGNYGSVADRSRESIRFHPCIGVKRGIKVQD